MISPRFVFSALLLLAQPVYAVTWVVNNGFAGAADGNPGTPEKPLLTINEAAERAQPGDTVLVHGGIYRERVAPKNGGKEGQPIIYQAAPGEAVAIKGSDVWTHWKPVAEHPGVFAAEIAGHVPAGIPNPFLIGISIAPKEGRTSCWPHPPR